MGYIDDDEFLLTHRRRVVDFLQETFAAHPNAPAVSIYPLTLTTCPTDSFAPAVAAGTAGTARPHVQSGQQPQQQQQFEGFLPRLSGWTRADLGVPYEGKLVLRSDLHDGADMFHVHYLTQVARGNRSDRGYRGERESQGSRYWHARALEELVRPNVTEAALLHYKAPFVQPLGATAGAGEQRTSPDIWGRRIPVLESRELRRRCHRNLMYIDPTHPVHKAPAVATAAQSPQQKQQQPVGYLPNAVFLRHFPGDLNTGITTPLRAVGAKVTALAAANTIAAAAAATVETEVMSNRTIAAQSTTATASFSSASFPASGSSEQQWGRHVRRQSKQPRRAPHPLPSLTLHLEIRDALIDRYRERAHAYS